MKKYLCECGHIRTREGCNACGHQQKAKRNDIRATASERGYDGKWSKFSRWFRAKFPLCFDCEQVGRTTPSAEVHHIKKLKDRPDLKYDLDNLMPLCRTCHQTRTARGE